MRIEGSTGAGFYGPQSTLLPSPREGRPYGLPPLPGPDRAFAVVHDPDGVVVIDLHLAAMRSEEPPSYRWTPGGLETGRKPRKGGLIDLLA